MMEIKKNQLYTVLIEGYSSEGHGVCRIDGRAVFVPRTLVGECWTIRIVKVTASAVYARGEDNLCPSKQRLSPQCPYFSRCGGCDCWHMSYGEELRFKLSRVNDALSHIGRQTLRCEEILGSAEITRYRNKGIFAVSAVNGLPCSGFYRERSHELTAVDSCLIQSELADRTAAALVGFMRRKGLDAYDEATGKGLVRHIFCRTAHHSGEAVAVIVAAGGFGAETQTLVETLRNACPELTGIVLNVNRSSGNTVMSGSFYTLWGKAEIEDTLCGNRFVIAPQAFFQINPPQAERLYARAVEYAALSGDELAFDLYCGAGTISLCLARRAGKVIGAEIVPEAVENARQNALINGIENAEFLCADAGEAAQTLAARGLKPQVVVVDPPRKGMSEAAVSAVASMQPERVVYVSCNPSTLARDILRFQSLGYAPEKITAVDMFPRTSHVETVVLMSRVKD